MACGIYSITNTSNGKRYYGSSMNVSARKRQHIHSLRKGTHRNKHLQAAWNLYGEESFVFDFIEEVASVGRLQSVEQSYLNNTTNGYNTSNCAECPARGLKWSEESKKRMSDARKGMRLSDETRQKLRDSMRGRKMSAEQRKAVSQRMTGVLLSQKTKRKLSLAAKLVWRDGNFRRRMLFSQAIGNVTDAAKKNRSRAMTKRWNDLHQRSIMSKERKSRWLDPMYRQKMLVARKAQGQRLRERNLNEKEIPICTHVMAEN